MAKRKLPVNLDKHIWEGWCVRDFIEALEPEFLRLSSNAQYRVSWWAYEQAHAFKTKKDLREWCKNNLPYIKRHIPDVANYFINEYGTDEDNNRYTKPSWL